MSRSSTRVGVDGTLHGAEHFRYLLPLVDEERSSGAPQRCIGVGTVERGDVGDIEAIDLLDPASCCRRLPHSAWPDDHDGGEGGEYVVECAVRPTKAVPLRRLVHGSNDTMFTHWSIPFSRDH